MGRNDNSLPFTGSLFVVIVVASAIVVTAVSSGEVNRVAFNDGTLAFVKIIDIHISHDINRVL